MAQKRRAIMLEKTMRQIALPITLQQAMQEYASDHNIQLHEAQTHVVEWYVKQKRIKQTGDLYYTCNGKAPLWTVWLEGALLLAVETLAKEEEITMEVLIFTAIVSFLQKSQYTHMSV